MIKLRQINKRFVTILYHILWITFINTMILNVKCKRQDWKMYINEEYSFSLPIPKNWLIMDKLKDSKFKNYDINSDIIEWIKIIPPKMNGYDHDEIWIKVINIKLNEYLDKTTDEYQQYIIDGVVGYRSDYYMNTAIILPINSKMLKITYFSESYDNKTKFIKEHIISNICFQD